MERLAGTYRRCAMRFSVPHVLMLDVTGRRLGDSPT
jgi:hypothetical protein